MIELMFLFFMKNVSQWGKCTFYKQGTFQITPFDGMVLKLFWALIKLLLGVVLLLLMSLLDLDLSYYNSLRVFNLLQNEDLELYPKR